MDNNIMNLSLGQLACAYIFIVLVIGLVRYKGINREKDIVLATFRMTVQLILTGYVLIYIFDHPSAFMTIFVILVMEVFSIYTVIKRLKADKVTKEFKKIIAVSVLLGSSVCIFYFLLVVIRIKPWYDPQYFIPIAGMFLGNSMTAVTLGANNLIEEMRTKKDLIEGALILGASPKEASKEIVNRSFDQALTPTINSMLGMGIVFLPGMMTGQILSGLSPLTAVSYQIATMLGILGAAAFASFIMVEFGYRTFFNKRKQLRQVED